MVFTIEPTGDDQNTFKIVYGATVLKHTQGDTSFVAEHIPGHFKTALSRFQRFPVETSSNSPSYVRTRGNWVNYFFSRKFRKMMTNKFATLGVRIRHGGERSVSLRGKELEQLASKFSKISCIQKKAFAKASVHTGKGSKDLYKGLLREFAHEKWEADYQPFWARERGICLEDFTEMLENLKDPRGYQTTEEGVQMDKQPVHYMTYADPPKPVWDSEAGCMFNGSRHVCIAYKRLANGKTEYGATIYRAENANDSYNFDGDAHWQTAQERLDKYPVKSYVTPVERHYPTRSVTSGHIGDYSPGAQEMFADLRKCVAKFGVRYRPGTGSHRFMKTHELKTTYSQQTKKLASHVRALGAETQRWNTVRSL